MKKTLKGKKDELDRRVDRTNEDDLNLLLCCPFDPSF